MKFTCKHCGQTFTVMVRQRDARMMKPKSARKRDAAINHLVSSHPEIAANVAGFTRNKGFAIEDHIEATPSGAA